MYENLDLYQMYEILYLKNGNTDRIIDYEKLVTLYNLYLTSFSLSDSEFLLDMNFFSATIYGFSYYHNLIFPEDKMIDSNNVVKYIFDMCGRQGEMPLVQSSNMNVIDKNYILSNICHNLIKANGLGNIAEDIIIEMCYNSYRIGKAYQKVK